MERDYKLLSQLTFKTKSYRKNFNLTEKNDHFFTEYEGTIKKIMIDNFNWVVDELEPPITVGEYSFTKIDFGLARKLDENLDELIKKLDIQPSYIDLQKGIDSGEINTSELDELIIIHNLIIHPDYRGKEITHEFFESMYRDHYSNKTMILMYVMPIQFNEIDFNFYLNIKGSIGVDTVSKDEELKFVKADEYFDLSDLIDRDYELSLFKLYNVAKKCGLNKLNEESNLFMLDPQPIINRVGQKLREYNKILL